MQQQQSSEFYKKEVQSRIFLSIQQGIQTWIRADSEKHILSFLSRWFIAAHLGPGQNMQERHKGHLNN